MTTTTYYIIDYNNLPESLEILDVCEKFYTLEEGEGWRKVITKELLHKFIEDGKVKSLSSNKYGSCIDCGGIETKSSLAKGGGRCIPCFWSNTK